MTRRDLHRHREDFTPQGVAGWMACPRCTHGQPVILTQKAAVAISRLLFSTQQKGRDVPEFFIEGIEW